MHNIMSYLSAHTSCRVRARTERTLEVWGTDLREHYLVTIDPEHTHLIDIVSLGEIDKPFL